MIARGCAALVVLVNFVFSVPVSPGHMDDKDVKVMKCIVEVIADALSKPHLIPVSQDCLETLSADDRLVSILRHRNFLREMQDIAAEDDQSMLVALDKPEEDAEKRGAGEENSRESEETEQESQKRNQIAEEEELEEHESPSNHISNSINPEQNRESQEEATKREEDKQEKKHSSLEKEKENDPAHHKDGETATDDHEANPDIKQSIMEDSEEHKGAETERTHSKEELEEEEEKKREVGVKRWSHVSKLSHKRVEASPKLDEHWEAPQHSKEREGQEGELWRSPEEQELQLMAQTQPQDKRDEEGSGSRKTGDAEIESLAAIESELESVAQKLHDLRRG
ncbi:chromogranin-A-like isoform X2 [Sinocyclocheilus grahami]|uniref:chromogranin-A-like isoform X2 n=1 Tax=Sinocyclocheilus grahami TaxID=75366 RepID=UPI0007AD169B|nr:PREDICTED: chromogranin-A-like isoform X2 [Sinocyclocheilus grahami]